MDPKKLGDRQPVERNMDTWKSNVERSIVMWMGMYAAEHGQVRFDALAVMLRWVSTRHDWRLARCQKLWEYLTSEWCRALEWELDNLTSLSGKPATE